jgi:hypothetical protein
MTTESPLRTLQLFYAALMVDAAANFEHFGVEARVVEKKAREQALAAPGQLAQLDIRTPRELFEKFGAIFGCAQWTVNEEAGGMVTAETRGCLACAIAKKRGAGRPCGPYCAGPFTALAAAMKPGRTLTVEETLWEGNRCLFRLGPA